MQLYMVHLSNSTKRTVTQRTKLYKCYSRDVGGGVVSLSGRSHYQPGIMRIAAAVIYMSYRGTKRTYPPALTTGYAGAGDVTGRALSLHVSRN